MVRVCLLIEGASNYFQAGQQAILSVLERSNFNIFAAIAGSTLSLPADSRIIVTRLEDARGSHRSAPFLRKLRALGACVKACSEEYIVWLDADAMFATKIESRDLEEALQNHALGMVEQTTISGTTMNRIDFLKHYTDFSLKFIAPGESPPAIERFRYFNSGFVLGKRSEIARLTRWAINSIAAATTAHQIGEHMIADQDYFQYWANNLYPGCCVSLPWYWNHCPHWDEGFPRPGARIVHFSNFCNGPTAATIEHMIAIRTRPTRKLEQIPVIWAHNRYA